MDGNQSHEQRDPQDKRLDAIEAGLGSLVRANSGWKTTIVAAVTALIASLGGASVGAYAALKANESTLDGNRAAFIAQQRRESYALLATQARVQLRILQLHRDALARGELPNEPANPKVGSAYQAMRSVSVDTELVGDLRTKEMSRCLVDGFLKVGERLTALDSDARDGQGTGEAEFVKAELASLQVYVRDFIDYGSLHLYDDIEDSQDSLDSPVSGCPSW